MQLSLLKFLVKFQGAGDFEPIIELGRFLTKNKDLAVRHLQSRLWKMLAYFWVILGSDGYKMVTPIRWPTSRKCKCLMFETRWNDATAEWLPMPESRLAEFSASVTRWSPFRIFLALLFLGTRLVIFF